MALNIPLVDGWRLRSDANNIILEEVQGDRAINQSFYGTISAAIESLIERKIRGFNSNTLFGLLNSIKSLQTALNKAIQPLKLQVTSPEDQVLPAKSNNQEKLIK